MNSVAGLHRWTEPVPKQKLSNKRRCFEETEKTVRGFSPEVGKICSSACKINEGPPQQLQRVTSRT